MLTRWPALGGRGCFWRHLPGAGGGGGGEAQRSSAAPLPRPGPKLDVSRFLPERDLLPRPDSPAQQLKSPFQPVRDK